MGKGQHLTALLPAKPLGGQHQQAWEKQVWVREAHGSGAEGRWEAGSLFPNRRKVGENWHAGAQPACSSSKVFWPLGKLPQSSLIIRENNGKKIGLIEVKLT